MKITNIKEDDGFQGDNVIIVYDKHQSGEKYSGFIEISNSGVYADEDLIGGPEHKELDRKQQNKLISIIINKRPDLKDKITKLLI